jgi:nucleotide-binding universal stress UspA family protein
MIAINRILCPVDFSDASRAALDHAAALARRYEARLIALHVVPLVPSTLTFPPAISAATLEPISFDLFRDELRRFVEPVADLVPAETVVTSGDAARTILDQARTADADLLVLGTHGRSGFERLVLGSVAEKVLRRAACPVLTVPPAAAHAPATPRPPYRRILCPVDFSTTSEQALRYALSLAEEAKARLMVLHVLEWFPEQEIREHRHFDVPEYRRFLEEDARRRLSEAVPAEARAWCELVERVACGKPYREILRVAGEEGSDLIVLGVQGRGAMEVLLFGSTANHVVRQASCPVLTVRRR